MRVYAYFLIAARGNRLAVDQVAKRLAPTITSSGEPGYDYAWDVGALFGALEPYVLLLGSNFLAPNWPFGGSPCDVRDRYSFTAGEVARFERGFEVAQQLGIERELRDDARSRRWADWLDSRGSKDNSQQHRFELSLAGLCPWGVPHGGVERLSSDFPAVAFVLEVFTSYDHHEIWNYRNGGGQAVDVQLRDPQFRAQRVLNGVELDPPDVLEDGFGDGE